MKICPACHLSFSDEALFCPDDGSALVLQPEEAPTLPGPSETGPVAADGQPWVELPAWRALSRLLAEDEVEDLYILGPERVVVATRDGFQERPRVELGGREGLMALIREVLLPSGKVIDADSPFADARLPDGSRLHVALAPAADPWPQLVVRRARPLFEGCEDRLGRLIELGTLSPQAALLLRFAMRSGVSLLVAGATASGKTTLIEALGAELPPLTPVVCIEDTRELDLPGSNVSYLQARSASLGGAPAISARFLVQQALRKRPRWVLLGEARGDEAWDFAQAGNTGHAILASVHANGPRDALERYRDLCLGASGNLGEVTALRAVLRAFRLVVFLSLDPASGRRVVQSISDVTGTVTEGGIIVLQDLFGRDGQELRCTLARPYPRLEELLRASGCDYAQVVSGSGVPRSWRG